MKHNGEKESKVSLVIHVLKDERKQKLPHTRPLLCPFSLLSPFSPFFLPLTPTYNKHIFNTPRKNTNFTSCIFMQTGIQIFQIPSFKVNRASAETCQCSRRYSPDYYMCAIRSIGSMCTCIFFSRPMKITSIFIVLMQNLFNFNFWNDSDLHFHWYGKCHRNAIKIEIYVCYKITASNGCQVTLNYMYGFMRCCLSFHFIQ